MRWKLAFISLSAFICISDTVATEKPCFEAYLISAVFDSSTERQSLLHILSNVAFFSLERRWSSRTFRYGYLVTTSPQLSDLPSAAPSCVRSPTSGISDSHGVTGGVYKTRERIHRSILICDYYRFQLHVVELQTTIRTETLFLWFA